MLGRCEYVKIGPSLKIPIKPFFKEHSVERSVFGYNSKSVTYNFNLEGPIPEDAKEFIVSGPKGAILKKKGKGFILVSGEAHFLKIK